MQRTIILTSVGLLLTANVMAATDDVLIAVPGQAIPKHGLTSTSVAVRVDNALPYKRAILALPATVGQMTKQSDIIILGSITNVTDARDQIGLQHILNVQIHEVLFGECPSNSVRLPCNPADNSPFRVPINEPVIIFGSRKDYWPPDTFSWTFDPQNAKGADLGKIEVLKGADGIITMAGSTSTVSVVRGYIYHLRSKNGRDPVKYAKFLESLQSYSHSRVRDDARDDLLLLLDFGGISIRQVIVERAGLSEEMKGYAEWFGQRKNAARMRSKETDRPTGSP